MIRCVTVKLAVFGAVAALTGCAHEEVQPQSFAWILTEDDPAEARLAYGVPHSDHLAVILTCAPGSGRVLVTGDAPHGRPEIVLASGGRAETLAGRTYHDPFTGMAAVEAEVAAGAQALRAFARTGDLAMKSGARLKPLPARDEDLPAVRRFFERCA